MPDRTMTKPSPVPRPKVEEEPVAETEESPQRTVWSRFRRLLRVKVLAPVVVFCLVAGGAVFAWLQISHYQAQDDARASALDAGKRYAADISTYDYHSPNANLDQVVAHATDKFAADYRNASASLMQLIQQYQATSEGKVLDAAVTESDAQHAVVLAFVDQTIHNTNLKDPRIDRSRMRLSLVQTGGEWRLDEVTLL
ncbi:hypothetical protein FPZ12_039525 [Amycolatopsis acidicola]|uniref:Mce-associated membrane protein n=1 Tax=Amycolatopsis acidicola TaxID=2596893 RepID=A0A5N0UNV7_9PSEU|nr:hypothetical protein [Amycolatopsis acidicola]KAA9151163.1 hypothetical protein FPZ12_039525 [Amycolatopsis acidicola]